MTFLESTSPTLERASNGRWFGCLLLALAVTGPPRPRTATAYAILEGAFDPNYLIEIGFWVLVALFVVKRLVRSTVTGDFSYLTAYLRKGEPATYYFLFAILAVISTAYSVSPLYTFFFSIRAVVGFLLVLIVAADHSDNDWSLYKILFTTAFIALTVQVIMFVLDPFLVGASLSGVGYRFVGGIFADYGLFAGLTLTYCTVVLLIGSRRKNRFLVLLTASIAVIFLVMSQTRTTVFPVLITLVLLFVFSKNPSKRVIAAGSLLLLALVFSYATAIDQVLWSYITRGDPESMVTLTGRTDVMATLLPIAVDRLPWGDGFAAASRYWHVETGWYRRGFGASHDSISKAVLELGFLGSVLLVVAFLLFVKQSFKLLRHSQRYWMESQAALNILVLLLFGALIGLLISIPTSASYASADLKIFLTLVTASMLSRRISVQNSTGSYT